MTEGPVLVLGSNSFAGGALIDALLRREGGGAVVGVSRSPEKSPLFLPYRKLDSPRFRFHQLDMVRDSRRLLELFDEVRPAAVVNFAALNEVAPSNEHPGDYFLTNCVALADLVDSLRRRDYLQRWIQISSPEVYGSCPHALTEEEAQMHPSTPYAASKGGADLLLQSLGKTFGFPALFVRATNYYGRHQQLHKLIPRTVIRIRSGEVLELHGGGHAVKSWIHIRDVADALIALIERGRPGEVYHLTDSNAVSVRDVVRQLCELTQRPMEEVVRIVEERPGQDARYELDDAKARRELGWAPRVPFRDGLAEVVEWIDANWDEVQASSQQYRHASPRA